MNNQLSLKEAKRLSILKWEWIIQNGGDYVFHSELPDETLDLKFCCGFCERWKNPRANYGVDCKLCEFQEKVGQCQVDDLLYNKWEESRFEDQDLCLGYAKQILEAIQSIDDSKPEFTPCGKANLESGNSEYQEEMLEQSTQ